MECSKYLPTECVRGCAKRLSAVICLLALAACGGGGDGESAGEAFASTYEPLPSTTVVIRGATLLPGNGDPAFEGDILLHDGVIAAIGDSVRVPRDADVIDASGKYVTPGIIDVHSHLGVYPSPGVEAHADGNEATAPVTAEVWAEHSLWPQDPRWPAVSRA